MTTPSAQVASRGRTDVDKPVEPSAIASANDVATHGVGQILMALVHHSLAFPTEDSTDAAVNTIQKWAGPAPEGMDSDGARAPKEDVSQRIPPGGMAPAVVSGPVIDYNKLAQAILAAQKESESKK